MNTPLALASAAAFALLHSLWQIASIALLAGASLSLMRGASARARHAVGMAWLVAMAAAPAITFAICWRALAPATSPETAWAGASAPIELAGLRPPTLIERSGAGWLAACVAQLWLLGVILMVVRQFGGWRAMRRIERPSAVALPPQWQRRVDAMRSALGITRTVTVHLAQHVASPFTAHVLRPLIWLPLALLTRLPRDQVEALLAHELAHIRRLDWCWNALQCAIEATLFHHPGMWWLSRRIREEREHACDDLAVAVCGDAVVLAEALAALQAHGPRTTAPRFALAAEGGSLMKRVAHLLSPAPARPNWPDWRLPGVLLLLLCSGSLLAMQVVPPASLLTNLRFEASSPGPLTPGNHREFTASYLGEGQRRYRIAMDAAGHVEETYTEAGRRMPIDAGVRRWLASMPVEEADGEPIEPVAASAPREAAEPSPPRTPEPSDSEEFRALMATLSSDPRVVALTGQPVAWDRASFRGHLHTWGSRDFRLWGIDDPVGAEAAFSMNFAGPRGRVDVAWSGKTVGGAWRAESMTLSPLAR